jgi:hypothetical protein
MFIALIFLSKEYSPNAPTDSITDVLAIADSTEEFASTLIKVDISLELGEVDTLNS